jgi:hypothetical protein
MNNIEEEEKDYILKFYDGRVRRMTGKLSELQKLPVKGIEEAPSSPLDKLKPMPPDEGPPLPRAFSIYWPGR